MKRKLFRPIAIILMTALALSLTVIPLTAVAEEDPLIVVMRGSGTVPFELSFEEDNPGETAVLLWAGSPNANYPDIDLQIDFYFVNIGNIKSNKIKLTFADDITAVANENRNNISALTGTDTNIAEITIAFVGNDNDKEDEVLILPTITVGSDKYTINICRFAGLIVPASSVAGASNMMVNDFAVNSSGSSLIVTGEETSTVTFTLKANYEVVSIAFGDTDLDLDLDVEVDGRDYSFDIDTSDLLNVFPPVLDIKYIYNAPPTSSAPPSAPSMPWTDPEPNTPDSFLASLYFAALGRTPDEGGFDDWADALESGAMTATDVVYGFVFSPEMVNKNLSDEEYVIMLYAAFFARDPDEGGKAHWLGRLASGATRYDVFLGFANSVEFDVFCDAHGFVRV
ncbi:MAG: DUF4214 domain-containing protein [Oscillospiraceae bacterium]|nr:DUF4214 domain-containing protein [Oscillospiraceae bacterium]